MTAGRSFAGQRGAPGRLGLAGVRLVAEFATRPLPGSRRWIPDVGSTGGGVIELGLLMSEGAALGLIASGCAPPSFEQ